MDVPETACMPEDTEVRCVDPSAECSSSGGGHEVGLARRPRRRGIDLVLMTIMFFASS
jgi:hypothetical protein